MLDQLLNKIQDSKIMRMVEDIMLEKEIESKEYWDNSELKKKEELAEYGIEYDVKDYVPNVNNYNLNINFNFHIHLK